MNIWNFSRAINLKNFTIEKQLHYEIIKATWITLKEFISWDFAAWVYR